MGRVPRFREGNPVSMDAEDVMKRVACAECGGMVEDYAPGVSSVTVDGLMYHPKCISVGHESSVSAEYARQVHDLLTVGKQATRPANAHPLLSDEESEELVENYLLNVPAKVFAAKLEGRDIAHSEAACDPYPGRIYPDVPMN
jgi:hypothetical protein